MRMDWNLWATATPIAEWFGRALKRVKNLCCNKVCLAALYRKARSQESSVLASSHGLNMLPARAESCTEYACLGNIQFEYTVAADRSYLLCLGDRAEALSTLPTSGHPCVCTHTSTPECGLRSRSLYTRSCNCACHGRVRQCGAQMRVRSRARV